MRTKRFIAFVLVIVMVLQTCSFAVSPKDFDDFPGKSHWSYDAMTAALDNGLLQGKGDRVIAPAANLTRAEFAAVITRAFGATTTEDVSMFKDVKESDWFYQDDSIAKVYKMGVMVGTSDSTFHPKTDMKREEVFLALARAIFVSGTDEEVLEKFEDKASVDTWAKEGMIGMVANEYVNGYHEEESDEWTLKPGSKISREELAQVFYNLFKYYISPYDVTEENKGIFGGASADDVYTYEGSVVVRTPNVTLQNAVINGDLIVADGVGAGDFNLTNVTVNGRIIFRGGEGTVTFKNVTSTGNVIINDVNGTVNFHNYRDEVPFVNNLVENTPATFLKRGSGGGGGGGGITIKYDYTIRHYLEPLEEGKDYDEYVHGATVGEDSPYYEDAKDVVVKSVPTGTKAYPNRQANEIHGFEIDVNHENYPIYENGVSIKSRNHVFKVYFKRLSFDVSFDAKDPDGNDFDDLEVRYEDVVDEDLLPDAVEEEPGKNFIGWSKDDDGTVDDEIQILDNTTLYPVYTYEVKFVPYIGTEVVMSDVAHNYELAEGDYPDAPNPDDVENGKKYVGWSTSQDGSTGIIQDLEGVKITDPVTYYQIVVDKDAVKYVVESYFEELDGSYRKQSAEYYAVPDFTVSVTPDDSIEGFKYFAHPDEKLQDVVPDDDSLVLKVYYNRETYDITFVDEEGNPVKTVDDVKYGDTVDASEIPGEDDMPKIPGKKFEGWSTDPNATQPDDLSDVTIDENTTKFYPVYTDKQPSEYKVEYYFENLDGSYSVDDTFTVYDSGTPDFEVTADKLDEADIPEGFEYVAHADEVLSEILPDDDSLVLKVYYKRIIFMVNFAGISENEYKYGYELTLDDIPEDDEVTVPADKKFMGWSTDPNATSGTKREDLAGTKLTEGTVYYPVIVDKDAVEYVTEYYFEDLDGNYAVDDNFTKIASAKPTTEVEAEKLAEEDIPEGFEYTAHADEVLNGTVPADGSTLTLKVYYKRITFMVNFAGISENEYKYGYELTLDDIPEDDEVTVPADKKFMGWSTDPNATSGTKREDLAGTKLTEGTVYYPIIVDKDAVEYVTEYYFEDLDGNYAVDDNFTKRASAKPTTEVEAEKLAEEDIPEGFEYTAHADEVLKGTVPADGSTLTLKVYYKRLTYKVTFSDISENEYKYGYKLTLNDIPEDDEVDTPDDKLFAGWATEQDAESGMTREQLAGQAVTGETVYYPVFVDKTPVEYVTEYYFENLDGDYAVDDNFTKRASAKPTTEVEAEKLAEEDIPEGFEYTAHADEVLKGTVPVDGSTLTLKVYYKRLTFRVVFDGISENEYKYGYKLTLDDIPEDDEVDVADDEKFVGWSTEQDATSGTKREDLVGTEITEGTVYYPVIVDKDAVEYVTEHYFEDLDGNYVIDDEFTVSDYAKPTTKVTATVLEGEDLPEGFEYFEHDEEVLEGTIPTDGTTLTLKVYYSRVLVNIYFYDATDDYFDSETGEYSKYSKTITVKYGSSADDEENYSRYPSRRRGGNSEDGFYKDSTIAPVYTEDYVHEIPLYWWYVDEETDEYVKLYDPDVDSDYVFTEDLNVYSKAKILEVRIQVPDTKFEGYYYVYYDDDTRFLDTGKDALFVNASAVTWDVGYVGIEDKFYGKLAARNLMVNVGGNYEIVNINRLIRFARLMGEENFEEFLESFYGDEAAQTIEEFLFEYITTNETEATSIHLKELIDDLVGEHSDIAHSMISDIAVDIIEYDISFVENFFIDYVNGLVAANDTKHIEGLLNDMFTDYKKENEKEFVTFVSDTVIKAISDDTPNATVLGYIEDYIKTEIQNGTFDDEIISFIMEMDDADFVAAATDVIKGDVSIIEEDVKAKILTDDSFVETMIEKIFDLDSDTVDEQIKDYIKDYNLVDEYILANPEVIAEYISDEQIGEFDPDYTEGKTYTDDEKIEAIEYYLENEEGALEKLKEYAGSDLDKVIDDYYDNNKDTVEAEMVEAVLDNGELRAELADFAITLIKDDEYASILDFAIDEYLAEVVADEDKKLELAKTEVSKLGDDDIFNLDFVQDAVDTVIDDVIADIVALENDGDETTESKYVANIKEYVKGLTEFEDIINAVLNSSEEFRSSIVKELFDNLYLIDSDHTIILSAMNAVTDKMIDEQDVDVNILITIVDYIKYAEHGEDLAWDIVENLLKIDHILEYAEEHLGWIDETGGQLAATLKFKNEVTYEEQFEVTADNLFIMDMVMEKVESMSFDKFMEDYVYGRVPEKVFDKVPVDDIVRPIYDDAKQTFLDDLAQAIENVNNGMTDQWVDSGFVVSVNPVDFVIDLYDNYLIPGYEKANAKAESYGGRVSELYLAYYRDNPYIENIVDLSSPEYYVSGTANDSHEPTSGYYINSFEDIYYDVIMPGAVLGDDLLVWYLEHVDFAKLRGFAEDNEDLILAMYNHPNVLAQRYAEEGLPETIEDYYDDLMENDEIREAFEKIDNKVSFEMEPFVMRFITNETAEMYYYKALERFGMKAEEILGKYDDSDVKKELTHDNFVAILDEIEFCWIDGNANATTDYVLDGGLQELFSIVSISKSFRGYTVSFERRLADR